jgi:hypothetical protein
MLPGTLAFRQARVETLAGELMPVQKSVKFRGREIQIPRDLFEFRPIGAAELIPAREPGDNGAQPANQGADTRQSCRFGGNNRHWASSRGEQPTERVSAMSVLTSIKQAAMVTRPC